MPAAAIEADADTAPGGAIDEGVCGTPQVEHGDAEAVSGGVGDDQHGREGVRSHCGTGGEGGGQGPGDARRPREKGARGGGCRRIERGRAIGGVGEGASNVPEKGANRLAECREPGDAADDFCELVAIGVAVRGGGEGGDEVDHGAVLHAYVGRTPVVASREAQAHPFDGSCRRGRLLGLWGKAEPDHRLADSRELGRCAMEREVGGD